jgi:hypothetical protein
MPNTKKIYIAGALTITQENKKDIYEKIGKICEFCETEAYIPHIWGTDPIENPELSAEEVWHINQRRIAIANLMIAYVGQPSLGTGAEMEIARSNSVDILIWNYQDEKISRMATGNPGVKHHLKVKDDAELIEKLEKILKQRYGK